MACGVTDRFGIFRGFLAGMGVLVIPFLRGGNGLSLLSFIDTVPSSSFITTFSLPDGSIFFLVASLGVASTFAVVSMPF